jgi:hypothetical protein
VECAECAGEERSVEEDVGRGAAASSEWLLLVKGRVKGVDRAKLLALNEESVIEEGARAAVVEGSCVVKEAKEAREGEARLWLKWPLLLLRVAAVAG